MTASSPSSVAESISNTVDPDAQERRANDDELSAGFQSDVAVNERVWGMAATGSVRPGPMPAETEAHSGRFAELIADAVAFRSRRSNLEGW
jgi:hypothetical protein